MSIISIKNTEEIPGGWRFTVAVDGRIFTVELDRDYYQSLTDDSPAVESLIEASFEFLLDNEPLDDIISNFSVSDIETYFPEYPNKISSYITR